MIHLVERAPPPPSQPGSGSGGTADSGPSPSSSGTSQAPPHDRNANSYVMLGTFNVPVNIMDPQQIQVWVLGVTCTLIPVCRHCAFSNVTTFKHSVFLSLMQMSVQQMMAGMGENARNARVTTSTGVKIIILYSII